MLVTRGQLDINLDLDRLGTFLILAIRRNNITQVSDLLGRGADPNLGLFAHLYTPLACTVEYAGSSAREREASIEIIDLLVAAGAKFHESNVLHVAALHKRLDVLTHMLGNHAVDVNSLGFEYAVDDALVERAGRVLHFAVDGGSTEVVQLLLKYGADTRLRDIGGRTPIERARQLDNQDVIDLLKRADDTSLEGHC